MERGFVLSCFEGTSCPSPLTAVAGTYVVVLMSLLQGTGISRLGTRDSSNASPKCVRHSAGTPPVPMLPNYTGLLGTARKHPPFFDVPPSITKVAGNGDRHICSPRGDFQHLLEPG